MQEIFKIRCSVFLLCSSSFYSKVKQARVKESTAPQGKAKGWEMGSCSVLGGSYITVKKKHFNFGECCAASVVSYFKFSFGFESDFSILASPMGISQTFSILHEKDYPGKN